MNEKVLGKPKEYIKFTFKYIIKHNLNITNAGSY